MISKTYSFIKNGKENDVYTITNKNGSSVQVLTYGARVISLKVPSKTGDLFDVIVGCNTPEEYYDQPDYFGATVGRYCNRIEKGKFSIDGVEYQLDINQGENSLHGGNTANFDRAVWTACVKGESLELTHFSPDGAGGYPGNMQAKVVYTLTDDNELKIDYTVTCDKDCPCNLTNHSFFCLSPSKRVVEHTLMIDADYITPCDDKLIPHDELRAIKDTAFSFLPARKIDKYLDSNEPMILRSKGYDLNYCLNRKSKNELERCAYLYSQDSGIMLEVFTTKPGLQIYCSAGLGKYQREHNFPTYYAICLETQFYPNSPNCPSYPNSILRKGEEYKHQTIYKFSVKDDK
jgi:aldose 1-epimerase